MIVINFSSSIGNDAEHVMHSKSDNIKILINDGAAEIIKNFLNHSKIDIRIN